MIDLRAVRRYCGEDISLIENYEKAVNDKEKWDCHHVWETMLGYSKQELIDMDEYYGVPACNLIFLTHSEHMRLHNTGEKNHFYNQRFNGEKNPFYGKKHTQESKKKMSEYQNKNKKQILQFDLEGNLIGEYSSLHEAQNKTGFLRNCISNCCKGVQSEAYGYVWRYK